MSSPVSQPPFSADTSTAPQISYAPVPDWVRPLDFDPKYPRKDSHPLTYLLVEHQEHAELRGAFSRDVVRLETMQAVQQMSQWRRSFDPLTQSLTLHHLRIHRDGEVFDYAKPENVRLLQREESLEAFILHGRVTVLVVFDDVRPGDIIETSYSILHTPRLLPLRHSSFFTLTEVVAIAKHHHSLVFDPARAMRWMSSSSGQAPETDALGTLTRWTWRGADRPALDPEPNVPGSELPAFWLQFSDVSDWSEVSEAAALAWNEGGNDELLDARIAEISAAAEDPLERIERVLRFAQDEFRYLSVNLELGGHIPTPPATVLRRRYGDCKDLSFLLACLLRKLGVAARPVLVNTALGPTLAALLPGANLFNHAIIELTVDGETRWIDATIPRQGGGPLGRAVPSFGFGLPVANPGAALTAQPAPAREIDRYEVQEILLLDTNGNPSLLKFAIRATGRHADVLRAQIESEGIDSYAQSRAKWHAQRYVNATLHETPVHADDRALNEWRMIETFLVQGFLVHSPADHRSGFTMPANLAATALPLAGKEKRRQSFALPESLHIEHTIEVRSRACYQQIATVKVFKHPGILVKMDGKYQPGRWSRRTTLVTSASAIPAADVEAYRKFAESVWNTTWTFTLGSGIVRPRRGIDFSQLPESSAKRPPLANLPPPPPPAPTVTAPVAATPPPPPAAETPGDPGAPRTPLHAPSSRSGGPRRRRHSRKSKRPILIALALLLLLIGGLGYAFYRFF